MRPVLCMISPAAPAEADAAFGERARQAARAGVHLIQVRRPDLPARALIALVELTVEAVAGTRTRVLVNDRVDVAIAARAHGVHLRGDSMPPPQIRRLLPAGFLVGRSVHSADEAAQVEDAGGVDYLLFGTVFPTASKPGARVSGLEGLQAACLATTLPVLAVGGVTAGRAAAIAGTGAAGVAAIGLFADPPIGELPTVVEGFRSSFDTPPALP